MRTAGLLGRRRLRVRTPMGAGERRRGHGPFPSEFKEDVKHDRKTCEWGEGGDPLPPGMKVLSLRDCSDKSQCFYLHVKRGPNNFMMV